MLSFNKLGRSGRFGNQMFQYAALMGVARRKGYAFCIPGSKAQDLLKEHQLLEAFYLPSLAKTGSTWFNRTVREASFVFDEDIAFRCKDNSDLRGYFQSEKYFIDMEATVRREFVFRSSIIDRCVPYFVKLAAPAISLHVRRTDYIDLSDKHPPCGIDYYEDALSLTPHDLPVIVFSDDIAWCKTHPILQGSRFHFSENRSNLEDMCLMTMCDHHIIANSSFSWWGAWLGSNPTKRVIAPKKWFGPAYSEQMSTRDLLPESWIVV